MARARAHRRMEPPMKVHATTPHPTNRRPRPPGGIKRSMWSRKERPPSLMAFDPSIEPRAYPTPQDISSNHGRAWRGGDHRRFERDRGSDRAVPGQGGFEVVVGARRLDRLREVAEPIGATALPLDVADPASVA